MPTYHSEPDYQVEPKQRFYPPQGMQTQPRIPSVSPPNKQREHDTSLNERLQTNMRSHRKAHFANTQNDDAAYLMHRHPVLLQRLHAAADTFLASYRPQDFIYDTYPDYLSLRLMRDRLLRENNILTEEFLHSGCPIEWLNLLTDTVISDLLCRKRLAYRNPRGEASTTSVQSVLRS